MREDITPAAKAMAQNLFDRVALHLLTQKKRAMSASTACVYHSEDGSKCAVGALIKDEYYYPALNKKNVFDEGVYMAVLRSNDLNLNDFRLLSHEVLGVLQNVHDHYEPEQWQDLLYAKARYFDLIFDWRAIPDEREAVACVLDEATDFLWDGLHALPTMVGGLAYDNFSALISLNEVRKYSPLWVKHAMQLIHERIRDHGDMWGFLQDKGIPVGEIKSELLQTHKKAWMQQLAQELRGPNAIGR